jgi:hypothetical protein
LCWFGYDSKEKVNSTLTDKKGIIAKPALASPIDTIKCQPDIFSNLVMMSTGDSTNQNYSSSINGQ